MKTSLLAFFLMASLCALAGDAANEQLLGHWKNTNEVSKSTTELTFRQDGTFVLKIVEGGKVLQARGNWSLKDRTLTYEFTSSTEADFKIGRKKQVQVAEITKQSFVGRGFASDGAGKKFVRVE